MKIKKITYCIPSLYSPGGMERVLTMKANYLAENECEVHIIITDGVDKAPYFPLNRSIQVHQLDIDFEEPYRYSLLRRVWVYKKRMKVFRRKLDECLNQIKPDITISLLRRDVNIINKMTDGSLKIGEIHFDRLHYRNFYAPWLPSFIYNSIQRKWMNSLIVELRKLSKFVVLTHEDAAFWSELHNLQIIPNPASFFAETTSDCSRNQVIAVGRYVGQKGFDRLIMAWRKVVEKHPDWILKIYGDGWMRDQLQRKIVELKIETNCFLEQTVSDIITKYQESSIFVLSSRYEGFGLVIVEAMACGLPVVSFTCHCGPRDIISHGIDGLLVEDGDIDGLAENINKLIEDEELRREMGRMARLKAANYRIEHIGAQWIALFQNLLSQERR